MWQDVRLAVRGFRKTPVFSVVAVTTLALATGATTAVFSLLNALILRDAAVRDPHTLVQVAGMRPGSTARMGLTFPMYQELRRRQQVFSAVMGWLDASIVKVETGGGQTQAAVWVVSGNFYDELGVRPLDGRLLNDEDVNERTLEPGRVAVLGHAFWIRHFGGDRHVLGQRIRIEDEWFEIVGIAPEGFRGLNLTVDPDVTLPLTAFPFITDGPRMRSLRANPSFWVRTTGRLKPGVTIEQARVALETLWAELKRATVPTEYAGAQRDRFLEVRPSVESAAKGIEQQLRDTFTNPLIIVLAIAALILLIACVNLASLLLARAATRVHEMGVRLALGAGRGRLVRQLLVEGILLSSIGAACGVWVAYWCSQALVMLIFRDYLVSASLPVAPDAHVVGFVVTIAIATGTLFSLAPAGLAARLEPTALLQRSTRTATTTGKAGRVLVGVQVGLSLVLLTNAGLLVRTLQEVRAVGSGMRSHGVFLASLAPQSGGHIGVDNDTYYRALVDRATAVSGVEKFAVSLARPAGGSGPTERVSTVGLAGGQSEIESLFMPISPGLFDTLGIPLKSGRDFTWSDTSRTRSVAVISESLAHRLFPGTTPIGRHIRVGVLPHRQDAEIVGLTADAHLYDLKNPNVAAVYVPALQEPNNNWKSLVIRGGRVPIEDLNRAVGSFGRERVRFTRTLDNVVERALLRERIIAMLATFFGLLALVLVSIGVYGLMSYAVAQRRREIGIRMALGADARSVIRTVVQEGVIITLVGVAGGLAGTLVTVRLVKSLLFGVSAHDSITLAAGPATLIGVAIIACLLPAVRAARVDPMVTLRAE